jgi:3-oxoadipate enol-lactonase
VEKKQDGRTATEAQSFVAPAKLIDLPFLRRKSIMRAPSNTSKEPNMPRVTANGITINYEQQGTGDPLILIPFLSADNACYAFQVAEYAKHFTCISLDLRGTGESDKPEGVVSTELYADDVAAFMQAAGMSRAHIAGLSLGAAIGMWVAAKHPDKVRSLSLHSGWTTSDPYLKTVVEGWQVMASALDSVPEMVIRSIFPWCLTPDLYAARYEHIQALSDFVRSRPPMSVEGFMQQSNAVIAHDVQSQLSNITAPTQITFGRHDQITSLRFSEPLTNAIPNSELVIFETCAHAPIYESVEEFNSKTLAFLKQH